MKKNYYECARDIVHAPCSFGNDYSLCGLTVENVIPSKDDFDPASEDEIVPQMVETSEKVTCPDCVQTIRYCLKLGEKSIARGI